jgi:hypothetical protein
MTAHLEFQCIFNRRCKKVHSKNITYYFYISFVADLPTHGRPSCLFLFL